MHVAMNRVDPVVVHYLQMSLHDKNVLNNLCFYYNGKIGIMPKHPKSRDP